MATDNQELALENLLNRATNPVNREEDWEFIMGFCDQINNELEGPQIACRLIAHKIQSPQEREAMLALSTLESCVKNCGRRFHQEIGKFRFLNEIIKVISPKYFGSRTPEKIKKKCIELLYSWSKGLDHETKIREAYTMLKSQGVITEDPVHMDTTLSSPSTERPKNAIFEDDEKSKLLARLLKSRSPEDLQAANRLIKNMVKEDNDRMDRVSRRMNEIEKICNNMKLLAEMVDHYREDTSSQADKDMMKELFETLEKNRPILFKLASETDEKDNEGINEILKTNDEMMKVMNLYKNIVENLGDGDVSRKDSLLDLDFHPSPMKPPPQPDNQDSSTLLQDQLSAFGLDDATQAHAITQSAPGVTEIPTNLFSGIQAFPTQGGVMHQQGGVHMMSQPALRNPMVHGAQYAPRQPAMFAPTQPTPSYASLFANSGLPPTTTTHAQTPRPTTQKAHPPSLNAMDDLNTLGKDWLTKPSVASTIPAPVAAAFLPQQSNIAHVTSPLSQPSIPLTNPTALFTQPIVQPGSSLAQPVIQHQNPAQAFPAVKPSPPFIPPTQTPIQTTQTIAQAPQTTPQSDQLLIQPSAPITTPQSPIPPLIKPPPSPSHTTPVVSPSPVDSLMLNISSPTSPSTPSSVSLSDLNIPLDSIKPGSIPPLHAYEKNGLKIVIHFGKDSPQPGVTVMVVSTMSTNAAPITGFTFQAAVPKVMKVKLQPPSATGLPAHNPILPPTAITQVMLLANSSNERVRLKFKLKYALDGKDVTDFGDVDGFSSPS